MTIEELIDPVSTYEDSVEHRELSIAVLSAVSGGASLEDIKPLLELMHDQAEEISTRLMLFVKKDKLGEELFEAAAQQKLESDETE